MRPVPLIRNQRVLGGRIILQKVDVGERTYGTRCRLNVPYVTFHLTTSNAQSMNSGCVRDSAYHRQSVIARNSFASVSKRVMHEVQLADVGLHIPTPEVLPSQDHPLRRFTL